MKKIFGYLRAHLKEDFHGPGYLFAALLITALVLFNYHIQPGPPFARNYYRWFPNFPALAGVYLLWYGIPYVLSIAVPALLRGEKHLLQNKELWGMVFAGVALIAVDGAFSIGRLLHFEGLPDAYFWRRIAGECSSLLACALPLLLLWLFWEKEKQSWYGLTLNGVDWKPYLLMLAIMLPVVAAASFQPDFNSYYPRLKPNQVDDLQRLSPMAALAVFELFYLADFSWTELLYRGFLVIGMTRVLGPRAVLPMAVVYCMIHFSKPEGEAISAIFGGYLLGVIALKSRNIMGGVMIHMGIAALMEVFALAQWYARSG